MASQERPPPITSPKAALYIIVSLFILVITYQFQSFSLFGENVQAATSCIKQNSIESTASDDVKKGKVHIPDDASAAHHSNKTANYEPCNPENFLVMIKASSHVKYLSRRMAWRESKCPVSYRRVGTPYYFLLGLPLHTKLDPSSHNQAASDSEVEILNMQIVRNESIYYNDMAFLSMRDVYTEFHLKTLRMMEWAVDRKISTKTSFVIFHDDDYCLVPTELQNVCQTINASNYSVYAGHYLWDQPVYEIQKGFDGSFAPYFSGNLYILSADLLKDIVSDPSTIFGGINASHSEDLQMGRWVKKQANRKDRSKSVIYKQRDELVWSLDDGSD